MAQLMEAARSLEQLESRMTAFFEQGEMRWVLPELADACVEDRYVDELSVAPIGQPNVHAAVM